MTRSARQIPIFPLNTVLFPDGNLPLRIFEPRYLDMISRCLKTESGFGICLIKDGKETGPAANTYNIGTLCEISYFNTQADGLLVITASGKQRFRILSSEIESNQLTTATVELLPKESSLPLPDKFISAAKMLQQLFEQLGQPYTKMPKHYDCASWVSCRLVELLPFDLKKKQSLLELNDPLQRIEIIWEALKSISLQKSFNSEF